LLTRMCSGPLQCATKAATEARSARSSHPTRTEGFPVEEVMSAAVRSPASVLRTASVTSAPAPASVRAVSIPMPDEAPVTIARLSLKSTPAMTSAAVESKSNGVLIRGAVVVSTAPRWTRDEVAARAPASLRTTGSLSVTGETGSQVERYVS